MKLEKCGLVGLGSAAAAGGGGLRKQERKNMGFVGED